MFLGHPFEETLLRGGLEALTRKETYCANQLLVLRAYQALLVVYSKAVTGRGTVEGKRGLATVAAIHINILLSTTYVCGQCRYLACVFLPVSYK